MGPSPRPRCLGWSASVRRLAPPPWPPPRPDAPTRSFGSRRGRGARLRVAERAVTTHALLLAKGDVGVAARRLRTDRAELLRQIERLGIERPSTHTERLRAPRPVPKRTTRTARPRNESPTPRVRGVRAPKRRNALAEDLAVEIVDPEAVLHLATRGAPSEPAAPSHRSARRAADDRQ